MIPARWQEIKDLLEQALQLPPEQRPALLERACTDDSMRRELESLLSASEDVRTSFLNSAVVSATLTPGTKIGDYEVIELIGAGGMGEIYRARDPRLHRDVAIKILPSFVENDPDRLRRFEQEARAAAALNHPHILAVFQMGSYAGVPYLVSELLEGCTLRTKLVGSLPVREAVAYAVQICRGLAAAHEKGIIHRDLKPENLFITKDENLKILDFGLAKLVRAEPDVTTLTHATQPGMIMGTVGYMSPEQVRGETGDQRSDIFAFGAILYEMLSGKRAFRGKTSAEVISAILSQDVPALPAGGNFPLRLKGIIKRCLEKTPNRRLQSARDLLLELEGVSHAGSSFRGLGVGKWVAAASAALLFAIAALNFSNIRNSVAVRFFSDTIDSIAVLPLDNFSGDSSQEYFADGMTESLIADLAKIGVPRVISRTSVMRYKGTHKSLPQIAKELGVNGIVEGSIVRSGDRVRVTAQLIFAPKDKHVWADTYDRSLRDILSIENDVSQSIANAIKLQLSPEEKAQLAVSRPLNPEAHDAYLRGRFFWNQRTEPDLKKAIDAFKDAISKDSNYAPAYSGLTDTYFYLGYAWGHIPPIEAMPLARAAAQKATELDPTSAEGHASLGTVYFMYDWNFPAAEQEIKRAIALNPNYEWGHHAYAVLLMATGRPDESISEARRAVAVDPLSVPAHNILGYMLADAGRLDETIAEDLKTLEIDPNPTHLGMIYDRLSNTYRNKSLNKEAYAEHVKLLQLRNASPKELEEDRTTYMEKGWRGLDELGLHGALNAWEKEHWHMYAYGVAARYTQLGDKDHAFEWLNKCIEIRSTMMPWFYADPLWKPLYSDPRFMEIKRKMGVVN